MTEHEIQPPRQKGWASLRKKCVCSKSIPHLKTIKKDSGSSAKPRPFHGKDCMPWFPGHTYIYKILEYTGISPSERFRFILQEVFRSHFSDFSKVDQGNDSDLPRNQKGTRADLSTGRRKQFGGGNHSWEATIGLPWHTGREVCAEASTQRALPHFNTFWGKSISSCSA